MLLINGILWSIETSTLLISLKQLSVNCEEIIFLIKWCSQRGEHQFTLFEFPALEWASIHACDRRDAKRFKSDESNLRNSEIKTPKCLVLPFNYIQMRDTINLAVLVERFSSIIHVAQSPCWEVESYMFTSCGKCTHVRLTSTGVHRPIHTFHSPHVQANTHSLLKISSPLPSSRQERQGKEKLSGKTESINRVFCEAFNSQLKIAGQNYLR